MPPQLSLISLPALALLIAANATPVVVARILGDRYSAPIDAHRTAYDGRPLLGSHKTWRGLVAGALASGLAGLGLSPGFLVGAAFGVLSLAGDLGSSFLKRRLNRPSGSWTPLLDQLPEALLPMIVLEERLDLSAGSVVATTLVFTAMDLIVARVIAARQAGPGAAKRPR